MNNYEREFLAYQQEHQQYWAMVTDAPQSKQSQYYRAQLQKIYQLLVPTGASVLELGCFNGDLLAALGPTRGVGIDFCSAVLRDARAKYPDIEFIDADVHTIGMAETTFDFIVVSDLANELWDIQAVLLVLGPYCKSTTRIIFNFHSHLWNIPLRVVRKLGLANPETQQNWITKQDLKNLLEISNFELLRSWEEIIIPLEIYGISKFINKWLARVSPFRHLALANFAIARPAQALSICRAKVSVIIAARNEAGHIEELVSRIPTMGSETEIIFVEGNSTDDTFAVIEAVIKGTPEKTIKLYKQTGKGKGDAVRLGFEKASGDILMILDADITVPPEDLPKFYDVMASGQGEFVDGVRLVYPMENKAMRFANLIGNKFFSWMFTWLLGQPIRDTLCGTKVLWKTDYERIKENRKYFGDFDLLFGAAKLNLKIVEIPVRYRARKYGETNISRWVHGWLLLKMVVFAARKIKFV